MALPALGSWLVVPQKRLRIGGLMTLLAVSSFMTPLSMDMYTPAIPQMSGYFNTTYDLVNLTLSGFFFFFTIGMLIFGPISDRFGRRPSLIASYVLYLVGSFVCAISPNIEIFIAARLIQGLGAGGASTISIAIIKDAFDVEHRGAVLGIMQVLFSIGPIVAPLLGAVIISFAGWRASFWALAVIGAISLIMSILMEETIPEEGWVKGGFKVVAGRLIEVSKHKGFILFLVITAMLELCFMAYIATAAYIYMDFFKLNEFGYSICFSLAAVVGVFGPIIFAKVSKYTGVKGFVLGALILVFLAGVLMLTVGQFSFAIFCAISMITPIMQACLRPAGTDIMLNQHVNDTGSASAVISFGRGVLGFIGMIVPVLPWSNNLVALGTTTVIAPLVGLVLWFILMRSHIVVVGVKDNEPTKPW